MKPFGEALEKVAGRRMRDIPPPACETCKDQGCWSPRYSPDPHGGAEQTSAETYCIRCELGKVTAQLHALAAARTKAEWIEHYLARVGRQLPPGMAHYTHKSYVQAGGSRQLVERLTRWLDVEPRALIEDEEPWQPWLYIGGTVGAGKTGSVVPLLLEHCRRGRPGSFITVPDWLSELRATYGPKGQSEDDVPAAYSYMSIDLLILDDLGVERNTDWSTEQLYMLINHRATHRKRTIITSNLLLHDLRSRLATDDRGRRIPSRIMEMCWADEWVISLQGKDLRQIKRTA